MPGTNSKRKMEGRDVARNSIHPRLDLNGDKEHTHGPRRQQSSSRRTEINKNNMPVMLPRELLLRQFCLVNSNLKNINQQTNRIDCSNAAQKEEEKIV